jgi:L-alanine-DL-glutamate epimerase-like enolase superfamily enzyme
MDRGFAQVLDRPGLGIDVDEDRVRHHRKGATLRVA